MREASWRGQFAIRKQSLHAPCKALDDSDEDAFARDERIAFLQPPRELLNLMPDNGLHEKWDGNMTLRATLAVVRYLPETMTARQQKLFFAEVESCFNIDRPCIVLECSKVGKMDTSVIHLLLCCLEEAMKRNGDVKLAALPPASKALLEATGVDRILEVFDTAEEAVESFRWPRVGVASPSKYER